MVVLLLKRELSSLLWCILVCNLVVLLVVMEWTDAITGDRVGLFLIFLQGEKFGEPFSRLETDVFYIICLHLHPFK
jgi:hypothetical protein